MFMTDRSALMTNPECHPGQQAYTFLIRILSTSFISVSIFSVCFYSRVSISMVLRLDVYVYNVYITNQFQTTFAGGWGGGGKSVVEVTVNTQEENAQDF